MEYKNDVVSKRVSNLNVLPIHVSVCGVHAPCVCVWVFFGINGKIKWDTDMLLTNDTNTFPR